MRFLRSCLIFLPVAAALWAQEPGTPELLCSKAVAFAENVASSFPGEYAIKVSRPPTFPQLKAGRVTFEGGRLSKQEPVGRFFVVFRVYLDGSLTATARVDLEGVWSGHLYQAKNALPRKTVITEAELDAVPFVGVPPAGALKDMPKNIRLRQPMTVGKILTQMDIEPIPLISASDRVRVTLQNGALQIVSEATARSSGMMGDRVRLEMDGSKKLVQALITGPGEAVIDVRNARI